jgi:hypothetical protein
MFARLTALLLAALTVTGCDFGENQGDCDPGNDPPRCDGNAVVTCPSDEYPSWVGESCEAWVCDDQGGAPHCAAPPPQALTQANRQDACIQVSIAGDSGASKAPAQALAALPLDADGSTVVTPNDTVLVDAVPVTTDLGKAAALAAPADASFQPHVEQSQFAGKQYVAINSRLAYLVELSDFEGELDLVGVTLCPAGDTVTAQFAFTAGATPGRVGLALTTLLDDAEVGRSKAVWLYAQP